VLNETCVRPRCAVKAELPVNVRETDLLAIGILVEVLVLFLCLSISKSDLHIHVLGPYASYLKKRPCKPWLACIFVLKLHRSFFFERDHQLFQKANKVSVHSLVRPNGRPTETKRKKNEGNTLSNSKEK